MRRQVKDGMAALRIAHTIVGCAFLLLLAACEEEPPELGQHDYAELPVTACDPAEKLGKVGITDGYETADGVVFNVRTPANYRPDVAHPLLVVYAPGGHDAFENEELIQLTLEATSAGFLIAYAADRRLDLTAIEDLAEIPAVVGRRWCVDLDRVALTGHSSGGLVASAVAFSDHSSGLAAAIAPSAAGITGAQLSERDCPAPMSVMVMHGRRDTLFPLAKGHGAEAARWWAGCNRCDAEPVPSGRGACVAFTGCAEGVETLYCETDTPHTTWPDLNGPLMDFLVAGTKDG